MRRTILSPVACLAVPYFPHYLVNYANFVKTLLNIKCVFWFSVQLLSETFLIRRRIWRDGIVNVLGYLWEIFSVVAANKNSPNVADACRKRRLKWIPSVRGVELDHSVSRGYKYGSLIHQSVAWCKTDSLNLQNNCCQETTGDANRMEWE
jgi:hypothetical protein